MYMMTVNVLMYFFLYSSSYLGWTSQGRRIKKEILVSRGRVTSFKHTARKKNKKRNSRVTWESHT